LLLAVPVKLFPEAWRWNIAQLLAVAFDVLNAVLIMSLTRVIGGASPAAFWAGVLYAFNPVTAALSAQAGSEPCSITFMMLFLLFALRARPVGWWRYLVAGLMLGVSCLIRTNGLVIAVCFGLAFLWVYRKAWHRSVGQMLVFGCAVLIPLMPWVARNYQTFNHFPILGAGGGETFFGGNNDLAADRKSPMWGYIVQPGNIPGATPLVVLAATMNEYEVDKYWMEQGRLWLTTNPSKIPGLVVGKLRRAFIPIPYNARSPVVLASSAYRAFLYVATLAAFIVLMRKKISMPAEVWLLLGSVCVANVVTTVLFCGIVRYVIGFEVLLCVSAGWFISRVLPFRHFA
jgi:hypothetical protein